MVIILGSKENYPYGYGEKDELNDKNKEEFLSFIMDKIPKRGEERVVVMTYDSEYDGLTVQVFEGIH